MTRKRFVKLAMSKGWSRNAANAMAKGCRAVNRPYAQAIAILDLDRWAYVGYQLSESISAATSAVLDIVNALSQATAAFYATLSECLREDGDSHG